MCLTRQTKLYTREENIPKQYNNIIIYTVKPLYNGIARDQTFFP